MKKLSNIVLVVAFFCIFAGSAFAHVCLVPQGMCAAKGCVALAAEDDLDYPVSHTDGDTTKISIQHQQTSTSQLSPIVLDLCYEPHLTGVNDKHAASYDFAITPTGMSGPSGLSSCEWDCGSDPSASACDGWHRIQADPGAFTPDQLGEKCDNSSIEATYSVNVNSMSKMPAPWDTTYPDDNVILARITFTGVNKDTAVISVGAGAPLYGVVDPTNIAKPLIDTALPTEVTEFLIANNITGTAYNTEIQVIPTQCNTLPVQTAQTLTCVPATTGTPLCPALPALTTVSNAWTPRDPPCSLPGATIANGLCGAVTYDLYVGGAQGAGGTLVSDEFTGTASSSTVLGIGDTAAETIEYWIYTNTVSCGSETTGKELGDTDDCACRTALITSVKVGSSNVYDTEPQAGTDITFTLTLTDTDSQPSELTIVAYAGCSGGGCTDGANSTYASPAGPITVCSPTTTPCSTSVSWDFDGETYSDFEDSDTAESLAVGFLVQESGATLSGSPSGYTGGDLTNFTGSTDHVISAADWKFSPYLIFKKDNEPYPAQLPFIATGESSLCLNFELIEEASVTLRIYHPDGTLIRVLDNDATPNVASCDALGDNKCNWGVGCKWDGTSYLGSGNLVANGLYLLHLYAVGTGTSYSGNIVERRNGIVVMK